MLYVLYAGHVVSTLVRCDPFASKSSSPDEMHGSLYCTCHEVSTRPQTACAKCRQSFGLLSPLLGPMLLLKAVTSLLVLPNVSFMLTSRLLMVSQHASLTISTTTKPNDCRSSLADCTDGRQSLTYAVNVTMDALSALASGTRSSQHISKHRR